MGAEVGSEGDVARLVEAADQIAGAQHRRERRGTVARVGPQIAVAQLAAGKQRCTAG